MTDRASYERLVRLGFSGIGGSIGASLRTRHPQTDSALSAVGIAPETVVAYVHPDQWVALHMALDGPPHRHRRPRGESRRATPGRPDPQHSTGGHPS